jgi:DNA invertase Pin-like site-specific DNA recombinase
MAILGYQRVSTAEQVQGTSLDEQSRKIKGAAMMRGADVEAIFSDPGVSGGIPLSERPQGAAMLAKLQAGDTVIVAKMDRIFRSAADGLAMIEQFKQAGIDLVVVEIGPDAVTQNGISKMVASILSVVADFERGLIRERVNSGRTAKRAKGGFIGGRKPFGYRVIGEGKSAILEEDQAEQKAIKRMHDMRRAGASLATIAKAMQADGFSISHMGVKGVLDRAGGQNVR